MKVEILLIISCAVFSAALPAKENFFDPESVVRDPNQIKTASLSYRLPNVSIPLRYDLWLRTDVDKAIFNFSGNVKIHVRIVENTQKITLNHRQITVEKVSMYNVDHSLVSSNLDFELISGFELFVISLPHIANADEEFILNIEYNSELRQSVGGFYRDSYESDRGIVWLATTQFLATYARHALPCYDEPRYMAVFNVEIQHDKSYNAISNTPLISREEIVGTDYVISKFQDTPLMSTHLLGFVISDFAFVSNNNGRVEQRVYAPPQKIVNGDGDFAIDVANEILKTFEKHLGIECLLSKIDHVALKNFLPFATENVGLITYPEEHLLPVNVSSEGYREIVTEKIAHNVAHQWFSGLISPTWWSYTWLNEAFATFYEHLIPSLIAGDSFDDRLDLSLQSAFVVDSSSSSISVSLNSYVESPNEIATKLGDISNKKGAAVLRMIREVMTPDTFTKGVHYYIKAMASLAATPDDLHRELQKAIDEDFPQNNINLDTLMRTWEDQPGFPLIEVEKYGDKFILTQWRFEYGEEIYSIPISYASSSDPDFKRRTPKLIMENKTVEIQSPNAYEWIILNIDGTGYFKVSYDKAIWRAFIEQLKSNHEVISTYHRRQLFRDLNDILGNPYNTFDKIYVLEMLSYLGKETQSSVWYYAPNFTFKNNIFGTSAYEEYVKFQRSLTDPHMRRLGFEAVEGESSNEANLRAQLTPLSCDAYEVRCLEFQLSSLLCIETG